ncbi:MAG: glycosyltransferase family 4 protein [Ignavibacteriaceae bacterium]
MANKKQSVLLLSVMETWGGGEEVLLNLASRVQGFCFYLATPPGQAAEIFKQHRLTVFEAASLKKIYRKKNRWTGSEKLKAIISIASAVLPLILFLKRKKISLIVANGNFAALFALPLVFLFKIKLVVIQHLLYDQDAYEGKLLNTIAKYADAFVCVSKSVLANIKPFFSEQKPRQSMVIYNGISLPVNKQNAEGNNVPHEEIRFAIIGSIIREKGHDKIIEVFSELAKDFSQCRLFIFGNPRENESSQFFYQSLQEKLNYFNITDKIFFKGYVADKEELYQQVDVVINYSMVPESFSLTVLEALAYQKLVIAANEGGPAEIIQHGVNGYLVEPRNKKALLQIMMNVVTQIGYESMDEIRKNGRKTVEEKFSLNQFAEEYKNLFDNVLSGNK